MAAQDLWGEMDKDIRASIAAALESRRGQQEPIEIIHGAWATLAERIDTLITTIGETGQRFASLREPTLGQAAIARELEAEPAGPEIQELRRAIALLTPDIEAIRRRVHRETVNIGVIGRVKAGKSTLLRTIANLGEETIPSTEFNPTTAARSRILHSPGRADADITLRTWPEFRDDYLAPLHHDAGCDGPVPRTPDEFASHSYASLQQNPHDGDRSDGTILQQKFLERLHIAQDSFGSYRELLTGPERKISIDQLAELRPYVAYPAEEPDGRRPYHAVRDVRIYCPFPGVDVENLMLVDLPGAGEAGLDIDRQFLQDLKNEVDVLLQVKRPGQTEAFFGELDWGVLALADEASMGVDQRDFVCVVINEDPAHIEAPYLENAVRQVREVTDRNGLRLLICDVASGEDVREQLLGPVLRGLADRLAAMDRAAAKTVVIRASEVAQRAITLADRLARQVSRWAGHVPDEEQALRERAKALRNDLGLALNDLRREYDRRVLDGELVPEFDAGISRAKHELMAWAEAGFGLGGREQWLAVAERAMVADPGETRDDQCSLVRQKIRQEFSQVDGSLASAVVRLQLMTADILRYYLGARLMPAGDQALKALLENARRQHLATLRSTLEELVEFRTSYGNLFLRVGRPVVRQIVPRRAQLPGEHAIVDPDNGQTETAAGSNGAMRRQLRRMAPGAVQAVAMAAGPAVAAGVAVAGAAVATVPIIVDWIGQALLTDDSAAGLYDALTNAFTDAVDQIEGRMRREAAELNEVLAAAADQFFDQLVRTPGIEDEFAKLCEPVRHELWRDAFDGRTEQLRGGLTQIAEAAVGSSGAGRQIHAAAARVGAAGA
jgi:hypothetical protein